MTIQELEKELKLNILEGVYLLYGEESFLLESSLKKMKKLFGELILRNKLHSNRWNKCSRINIRLRNTSIRLRKEISYYKK